MARKAQNEPPDFTVGVSWLEYFGVLHEDLDEYSFETYVSRLLQALMFMVCYSISRLIMSKTFWEGDGHADTIDYILLVYYIVIYLWCGFTVLPEIIQYLELS